MVDPGFDCNCQVDTFSKDDLKILKIVASHLRHRHIFKIIKPQTERSSSILETTNKVNNCFKFEQINKTSQIPFGLLSLIFILLSLSTLWELRRPTYNLLESTSADQFVERTVAYGSVATSLNKICNGENVISNVQPFYHVDCPTILLHPLNPLFAMFFNSDQLPIKKVSCLPLDPVGA